MNVMNRGYVHVEREGISFSYPCRPMLIATFNPEEGELGSNVLDKIGMSLSVDTEPLRIIERVSVVDNVLGFSGGTLEQCLPQANTVLNSALKQETFLREMVTNARLVVGQVNITIQQFQYLCQEATRADCEGHRGEIFAVAIAKASAALAGRNYVNSNDLRMAVQFTIFPRGRYMMQPETFDNQDVPASQPSTHQQQQEKDNHETKENKPDDGQQQGKDGHEMKEKNPYEGQSEEQQENGKDAEAQDDQKDDEEQPHKAPDQPLQIASVPAEFMFGVDAVPIDPILLKFSRWTKKGSGGKRSRIFSLDRGRFVKSIFPRGNNRGRLAVGATLRAAAPHQKYRKARAIGSKKEDRPILISKDDFRIKKLARKAGSLILFVTDASGSMALNRYVFS